MSPAADSAIAQLDAVAAALTNCEVAKARIRNYCLALANTHGCDAADDALALATADVGQLRAKLAEEAGGAG